MNPRFTLLIAIVFIFNNYAFSQAKVRFTDDTMYYDYDFKKIKPQLSFSYRPPVEKVGDKYHVKYYRTKNNSLFYEGDVIPVLIDYHYSIEPLVELKDGYFTFYYPEGHKSSEGKYVRNKRSGVWKFYYRDGGELKSETMYYDGQPVAYFTRYYQDGKTKHWEGQLLKVAFKDDTSYMRDDQWIFYNKAGGIDLLVKYTIGVLHDNAIFFDSATGKKYLEGSFNSNFKHGKWRCYEPATQQLIWESNYKKGMLDDTFIVYYSSGRLMLTGQYEDGYRTGVWKVYYDSLNKLKGEITYKNSKGSAVYYDSVYGNSIITKGEMSLNSRTGKWYGYFPANGILAYEADYKDNLLDGHVIQYSKSGNKIADLIFSNGMKNGGCTYYYEGTKDKWVVLNFDHDTSTGVVTSYYRSGKLKRKTVTDKGEKIQLCYNEQGGYVDCEPFLVEASFDGNLMTYIGDNLEYPAEAKLRRLQGKVKVAFTLDEWGKVKDPYIVEGFDDRCNEEALRLVSNMPQWTPQTIEGIPVTSYKTIPIVFWLPEEGEE